jgi:hypothetical protein
MGSPADSISLSSLPDLDTSLESLDIDQLFNVEAKSNNSHGKLEENVHLRERDPNRGEDLHNSPHNRRNTHESLESAGDTPQKPKPDRGNKL